MSKIELNKINRNSRDWEEVFKCIDDNFSNLKKYCEGLGTQRYVDRFQSTKGQTEFFLSQAYSTRTNSLAVYRNGIRQWSPDDFIELSNSSFKFTEPCEAHEVIVVAYTGISNEFDPSNIQGILSKQLDNMKDDLLAQIGEALTRDSRFIESLARAIKAKG